jgi:hypothetical protein
MDLKYIKYKNIGHICPMFFLNLISFVDTKSKKKMMVLKEDMCDWSFCVKNDKAIWDLKINQLISYNEEINSAIFERMSLYLYWCEDFVNIIIPITRTLPIAEKNKNRIRILKEEIGFTLHYGDPTPSSTTNVNQLK